MALRRADNASVEFRAGWLGSLKKGHIRLNVGSGFVDVRASRDLFSDLLAEQRTRPVQLPTVAERTYWYFQERLYWENDGLSADEVHALLVTRQQRERGRIERAQAMVAMGVHPQEQSGRRDVIPDDVKQLVFMRDGGRCVNCGAQAKLQFDHVIPVALGASSVPENLQILCGPCNRRKSAGLTVR